MRSRDDGGEKERRQKGEWEEREERSARRSCARGGMKKKLVNSAHLKNNVYIAYRCKVTILNLTECKILEDPHNTHDSF